MLRSSTLLAIALCGVLAPDLAQAQESPLTLEAAYEVARANSPVLASARAAAEAATYRERSVRLPPDPEIQFGLMDLSVPGLRADMPGSMVPSVEVMQMLPFPGKLGLAAREARQGAGIAERAVEEAEWEVRARVAMAFHEVYRADRQLAVMEETLEWLIHLEDVTTSMYSVGGGRQSDVLRAGVEVARMRADLARMSAMRAGAAARLNAALGLPATSPVPTVALGPLPADLPAERTLSRWAEESRPMLDQARIGVERARTRQEIARREIWPDLTLGVRYGRRPSEMGTERMGSVMIGFSVPLFAAGRQTQMRREADAMERMAAAELTEMRIGVDASISVLLAELDRGRTLVSLYRDEVLPQAEANLASSFASYRVGRVDFMTVVDAQMTLDRYRQERIVLLAEYGIALAEMEMTVGRQLPITDTTLEDEK
jgi:outer membrane protein, heavy metal efflux system